MGITIALVTAIAISMIALLTRPIILIYMLLFIFVFFDEFGEGFISARGSIMFNQGFIGFYKLKFIEIIVAFSYPVVLMIKKSEKKSYLKFEKILGMMFFLHIMILCFIEYYIHSVVTVSDWRFMVSGILIFHMLYLLVDSEEELIRFIKILMLFLGIRALIGIVMYVSGHGVISPRGMVPFFWDSRQIDAFVFGAILSVSYIANFIMLARQRRIFTKPVAYLLLFILVVTVILSMRRTLWVVLFSGIFLVLFTSNRIKIPQYISMVVVIFIGSVMIFSFPAFDNLRNRVESSLATMNVFSSESKDARDEASMSNKAHIDNLVQYSTIIMDNPEIIYSGFRGRSGDAYTEFQAATNSEGPLGTAHNGILKSIQSFGFFGVVLYLLFFLRPLFSYRKINHMPESSFLKHSAKASLFFLFLEFIPTLAFVPPFYNSMKGVFYTFIALFILRASIYYLDKGIEKHNDIENNIEPNIDLEKDKNMSNSRRILRKKL